MGDRLTISSEQASGVLRAFRRSEDPIFSLALVVKYVLASWFYKSGPVNQRPMPARQGAKIRQTIRRIVDFDMRCATIAICLVVASTAVAQGNSADQPSAEEVAANLANPNTPLASLTLKLQFRTFEGNLPNADDQDGTTLLFQPSFPFSLANGDVIFFRPAIPIQFNQPTFNSSTSDFDSASGLGDIAFDLAYGRTKKSGLLLAAGVISSLPTATDDALGFDRWTLGPEFLIGKLSKKFVLGAFPNHQWDVGGSGSADVSLTTAQLFVIYLPGGGWNVGTTPILSYNHETDDWTVPLNITIGKTEIWNGRPWKLSMEINYYVQQPDSFGPEWMLGFSIAPVVKNVMASWFK